jgi:hypothetical protein
MIVGGMMSIVVDAGSIFEFKVNMGNSRILWEVGSGFTGGHGGGVEELRELMEQMSR